jgi:hypothetical protein
VEGQSKVLSLIDRLDDLVHNAKAVPLTAQIRVDKEEIYALLDQIRIAYPDDIAAARAAGRQQQ